MVDKERINKFYILMCVRCPIVEYW